MTTILLATIGVTLVSLVGILFFGNQEGEESTHALVSLSIGVFLAVIFINLLPESFELSANASWFILAGFFGFFILSFLLDSYHHHHTDECSSNHKGRGARLLLIGDAIHNFVDGITIAASFMVHPSIGVATTTGIFLHEMPQELAEFILLVRGGYSKKKALLFNFLTASSVILGGVFGYYFIDTFAHLLGPLLGIAAGNLLYIATADLLPELRERKKDFWKHVGIILIGLLVAGYIFTQNEHVHIETDAHPHTHTHEEK